MMLQGCFPPSTFDFIHSSAFSFIQLPGPFLIYSLCLGWKGVANNVVQLLAAATIWRWCSVPMKSRRMNAVTCQHGNELQ